MLLVLLFLATQRSRKQLAPPPPEPDAKASPGPQEDPDPWATVRAATDIMLEIPAIVVLVLMLVTLPAAYGALQMTTSYPQAWVPDAIGEGISWTPPAPSGTPSVPAAAGGVIIPAYVLSSAASDAKTVSLLEMTGNPSQWVLQCRKLEAPWRLHMSGYQDILQETEASVRRRGAQAPPPPPPTASSSAITAPKPAVRK